MVSVGFYPLGPLFALPVLGVLAAQYALSRIETIARNAVHDFETHQRLRYPVHLTLIDHMVMYTLIALAVLAALLAVLGLQAYGLLYAVAVLSLAVIVAQLLRIAKLLLQLRAHLHREHIAR